MTKSNTTKTETVAVEAKAPSKMKLAADLFKRVFTAGFDLDGKSQRARFIDLAQSEIGLTKAGANTYFQNLSNEARGQKRYKYNTTKKAGEGETAATTEKAPSKAAVKQAEAKATATAVDLSKRWQILNKKGTLVNSFSTKAKAEAYAEQGVNLKVVDSKAA